MGAIFRGFFFTKSGLITKRLYVTETIRRRALLLTKKVTVLTILSPTSQSSLLANKRPLTLPPSPKNPPLCLRNFANLRNPRVLFP